MIQDGSPQESYHLRLGYWNSSLKKVNWNSTISEKMKFSSTLTLFVISLSACSKYNGEQWVATQEMSAFPEPNDDQRNPIFKIKKGEPCTPLTDSMAKIYAYTKVQCKSGTGWVIDDFFNKPERK